MTNQFAAGARVKVITPGRFENVVGTVSHRTVHEPMTALLVDFDVAVPGDWCAVVAATFQPNEIEAIATEEAVG